MLRNKSLTELRGIAQSFGITDIFNKDILQLTQLIETKQVAMIPEPKIEILKPEYDARLMNRPPSKRSDQPQIENLLERHIAQGLSITFDEERWYMAHRKKTDEGTLRMPLAHVLQCADRVMK